MKRPKQLVTQRISKRLQEINALSDKVASVIQINRNHHTLWASIEKNQLIIMTDDSVFATQLRFQQDIIRQHINQQLLITLKSIKIKLIAPQAHRQEDTATKCFRISKKVADVLSYIAEDIEDDKLKESLKKLGK
ncbi:MAG: hypothetical protein DSZ29_03160 [Aquificaceae bacterium]|nr:MAG: hypothetical protein DSZ29_03160 [Aquificaceae bacterium]